MSIAKMNLQQKQRIRVQEALCADSRKSSRILPIKYADYYGVCTLVSLIFWRNSNASSSSIRQSSHNQFL